MPAHRSETLSLPEACRILRLSYFQLYRLVLRGELPATQDSARRYRVSRAAVHALRVKMKSAASSRTRRSTTTAADGEHRRAAGT